MLCSLRMCVVGRTGQHTKKKEKNLFRFFHHTSFIPSTLHTRIRTPGKLSYTYSSSIPLSVSPLTELVLTSHTNIPKYYAKNCVPFPYIIKFNRKTFIALFFVRPSVDLSSNRTNSDSSYKNSLKFY